MAVCGASGGIGQPLSLLLKQSPLVSELSLYDIVHTPGVAADLSHIDTPAKVQGFNGAENVETALKNADVVIIPAGVPRKPGMQTPKNSVNLFVQLFCSRIGKLMNLFELIQE